jgi:hypothetical protein
VNVLSIAGIPGIGENIVTHGLGPASGVVPPTPTPTPVRPKVLPGQQQSGAGGGGAGTQRATNCEPVWREEWRDRLREQKRKQHEREMRAELDRIEKIKAQQAQQVLDALLEEDASVETQPEEPVVESVYEPLPVGIQGRVRAVVEGVVHYKADKVVEVVADDGARHVYEGVKKIAAGPLEGDRVEGGETIGRATRAIVDHRIEREVAAPAIPYPRVDGEAHIEVSGQTETSPSSSWPTLQTPLLSPSTRSSTLAMPATAVDAKAAAVTQGLPGLPFPRIEKPAPKATETKPETLGVPPAESTAVSVGKAALVVAAAAASAILIARSASSSRGPARKTRTARVSEATPSVKKATKTPRFRFKSLGNPLPRSSGSPSAELEPKPRSQRSTKAKTPQWVAAEPTGSGRARPIEDVVDYPPHAKIQEKWIRCSKPDCYSCPHGPYLQAMWWEDGKVKTKYLGKRSK